LRHAGKHVLKSQPLPLHGGDSLIQPVVRVVREPARSNDDDAIAVLPPVTRFVGNEYVQRPPHGEAAEIDTLDDS
jgi:hypothetical protein